MSEFSHLDQTGQLRMVEVGDKPVTLRRAAATCRIVVGPRVFPRLLAADLPKGDVWAAARLAGIMAAKNTAQLIPLCHPLPLTGVDIDFTPEPEAQAVAIRAQVRTHGRTGVEMEALVAAECRGPDHLRYVQGPGPGNDYSGPRPGGKKRRCQR